MVDRQSGALVVAGILDYLTFALCAPYSETTDGKQFDILLDKVGDQSQLSIKIELTNHNSVLT